ncbi:MAG: Rrf2 family transcriptional regulator [Bradyrhizobium sp.]|uniref:Rrf2 family transcriptional regulator n=1 Tax=Bradyrhizobium sp. TaxID=376 RepID=UPI0025C09FAD|nr:Rrf2 family transcriptional regulator [Bradyrhizobium sp.]MBI5260719.1 Rrf2 family transcriptional regulator [Bradyrhizobium sp.]
MKLQKATICGLYAVLELATHAEEQTHAADIARKYDISLNHLNKVLRTLVRARLIESVRGRGGGYRFCGNPKRLTLLDVVELFEDPSPDLDQADIRDNTESRTLHRILTEIDDIAIATLRSVSITSLVKMIDSERRKNERSPGRAARVAAE